MAFYRVAIDFKNCKVNVRARHTRSKRERERRYTLNRRRTGQDQQILMALKDLWEKGVCTLKTTKTTVSINYEISLKAFAKCESKYLET